MDLSFTRNAPFGRQPAAMASRTRVPVWPYMLTAGAAAQAASPTAQALANFLRGQEHNEDWVQALAHIFAPDANGMIEAESLTGSFSPTVASHLKVGKG